MLKVKKKVHKNNKNKAQENGITQLQNDIKNSIKSLYISDQKNKKTINDYAELLIKIRNEYAKLQQEYNQLKIQLQKCKDYVEQIHQRSYQKSSYQKPLRKRKHYQPADEKNEESDSYVTEIRRRRPKKQAKRRIIYEDEIDSLPEYEPESPTKDEQEEDNYEIQNIPKGKQAKQIEKPRKVKKGITKPMKVKIFFNFIFCE